MKLRGYIILALSIFCLTPPLAAQNSDGLRQQKEQELKAVLKSKNKTMSDIAKFIPYNIPLVNRSFYEWTKDKVVFYRVVGSNLVAVKPNEIGENIKADYAKNVTLRLPESYFQECQSFFEQRCYDQNDGEAVMNRFFHSQISLGTCLEKFGKAENTVSYVPYIQELVLKSVKDDGNSWQQLFSLYQSLPDNATKAKTSLGAMLCRTTPEVKKWVAVLKLFPRAKTFYYGGGDENYIKDKSILDGEAPLPGKSSDTYGGCLSGFVLYPDGRIIMRRTTDFCQYSQRIQSQLELLTNAITPYNGQGFTFMYSPSKQICLGLLIDEGTANNLDGVVKHPVLWHSSGHYVPSDTYELFAGCIFNNDGTLQKESYFGKATAQAANDRIDKFEEMKEQAKEQAKQQQVDSAYEEYYNQLARKYGKKAAWSIMQLDVFVGMPEGLLKEFVFHSPDNWNGLKVFYQLGAGRNYTVYAYYQTFRQLLGGRYAHCRIFCQGGRIARIDYNYYGPF